jgi:uncharacterized repeat protein (TIGR01451 family)
MRRMRLFAPIVFVVVGLAVPAAASATSSTCPGNEPANCLSLAVSHAPGSVSASTPLTTAYFSSTVTVKNVAKKSIKHIVVIDTPPLGSTAVSASSTVGSCVLGATVKCDVAELAAGATATILLAFTSPPAPGTATNKVEATFEVSEGLFGWTVPKRQSVVVVDNIPVTLVEGAFTSFLPAGIPGDISTSTTGDEVTTATRPQVAGAIIPAQPAGETVVLKRNPAPFTCPAWQVCRNGQWTEAHIDNTSGQPLRFELRWDASLVSYKQTTSNFAIFYRKTLDGPTLVISCHCNSTASNRPCLKHVTKYADGDFSVVLVKDDNGYMR